MAAVVKEKPIQFLTVRLGADEFGIALGSIREIVPVSVLTRVPGNPPWVRGVCNLRGTVLPVVDLGVRFGFGPTTESKWSMFLVLELSIGTQTLLVGVLATSVSTVVPVKAADIEPAPEVGLNVQAEYVRGLLRIKERFIVLLDVHRIFATSELVDLEAAMAAPAAEPAPVVAEAPPPPPAEAAPASETSDDPNAPGTFHLF
jgi:purine-binding chemotaxis protein CheW